jgi:molybdopterin-containing oxidoreductase family membrane subunit
MTTLTTDPAPDADIRPPDRSAAMWRIGLWSLFAVSAVAGTIGLVMRVTEGHLPAGYGSYVPWGLWIAVYFHGVGIAAGAFAVTAVGYLLRVPGFRDLRAVRLTTVLVAASIGPALLAVGLDLGQMTRAWRIFAAPSFTSMMAFNSWIYITLLVICAVAWWLSFRPDRGWLRPVLALGLLVSLAVPSQSGAFFGVVDSKPYWHSALLPILLLISAIAAGSATLLLVRSVVGRLAAPGSPRGVRETLPAIGALRWVVLASLVLYFFLEFAEFSVVLWNPQASAPEISMVLTGPYWWVFWLVHVVLGGIIPLALLITRRPGAWVLAAALVATTFISTRLNVLIPGQSISEIEGLQEAFFHPRLDHVYNATPMEYLVALFCLALGMAVLYVGWRLSAGLEKRLTHPTMSKDAR